MPEPFRVHQGEANLDQTVARLQDRPEAQPLPSAVYTADELAALLKVSRRAVERWAAAGKVPGRLALPGRAVRYRKDVIDEWIREGCPAPRKGRRV